MGLIKKFVHNTAKKEQKKLTFEEFYNQYYLQVFHYICKKINHIQDAEDLACNVFLYCFSHFADYDASKASYGTWLYLIVDSRIKNYYRDQKENVELEGLENVLYSEDISIEKAVLLEEQRALLAKAIKTLPERQQAIVIYKYFYNKSAQEIADKLGISAGNVRVLLNRALDKLEEYFKTNMK